MTVQIDRATLPPARKAKVVTESTPSGDSGWVGKVFKQSFSDANITEVGMVDGWTGRAEISRYPTEGHSMLVGGTFNGRERDMRPYAPANLVALPLDNGAVEWYERGNNPACWVWVATITQHGIELRKPSI